MISCQISIAWSCHRPKLKPIENPYRAKSSLENILSNSNRSWFDLWSWLDENIEVLQMVQNNTRIMLMKCDLKGSTKVRRDGSKRVESF